MLEPGWVEGWALVSEEEEGGGSRAEEEHGVAEVIKDWEGARCMLRLGYCWAVWTENSLVPETSLSLKMVSALFCI